MSALPSLAFLLEGTMVKGNTLRILFVTSVVLICLIRTAASQEAGDPQKGAAYAREHCVSATRTSALATSSSRCASSASCGDVTRLSTSCCLRRFAVSL